MHVLVDEPLQLTRPATAVSHGRLDVPSGKLWVCGAEYLAKDPGRGSSSTPKGGLGRFDMGRCVEVAPGSYALTVIEPDRERDEDDGSRRVTAVEVLQLITILLVGLGGLALVIALVIMVVTLVISVVILVVQFAMGSPNAGGAWAVAAMIVIVLAGLAALALVPRLGRLIAGHPAVARNAAAQEATRLSRPAYILVLSSGDETTR